MNSAGSLVNTYNYKAYGESLSATGGLENRYRYTGREYVESGSNGTELYYYRARYYRPDLGRFISKDPLGMIDGTNMFVYVNNNPASRVDRLGLFGEIEVQPVELGGPLNPGPDPYGTPIPRGKPNGPPDYWPVNGNLLPGYGTQDDLCSIGPKPYSSNGINSNPCLVDCCEAHDNCYRKWHCNQTSWAFTYLGDGTGIPCWECNREVVSCFAFVLNFGCKRCNP